ncbi:hypothetical protein ES708_19081 [subsurface metagenome]
MKEQSSNEQFKSHEIDFIDSLDRSEYSKTDLEFIERNISLFLEELKRENPFLIAEIFLLTIRKLLLPFLLDHHPIR